MATYVIGDLHGCFATLERLFASLPFDFTRDHLWLAGDLVNRGPRSLDCLRWAAALAERLGPRLVAVLGNHDLHLLALAAGVAHAKKGDTLEDILSAPDAEALLAWLGRRPLLYRQGEVLLVHAGLLPDWTPDEAEARARRLEAALQGPGRRLLLARQPEKKDLESEDLVGLGRDLAAFSLLRTCTTAGEPCRFSGPPEEAPPGCLPWFAVPGRRSREATVIFGHWAALGLHLEERVLGLDSACVWGGKLSAIRLEDRRLFQQDSIDEDLPSREGG